MWQNIGLMVIEWVDVYQTPRYRCLWQNRPPPPKMIQISMITMFASLRAIRFFCVKRIVTHYAMVMQALSAGWFSATIFINGGGSFNAHGTYEDMGMCLLRVLSTLYGHNHANYNLSDSSAAPFFNWLLRLERVLVFLVCIKKKSCNIGASVSPSHSCCLLVEWLYTACIVPPTNTVKIYIDKISANVTAVLSALHWEITYALKKKMFLAFVWHEMFNLSTVTSVRYLGIDSVDVLSL